MMSALSMVFLLLSSLTSTSLSEQNLRSILLGQQHTVIVITHVFKECIPLLSSRNDLVQRSAIQQDESHEVIFVIRQRSIDELTKILHDVSNPLSSNYGQYLTKEKVHQITTNPDSCDAVTSYLISKGAIVFHKAAFGDYVKATAPISLWENIFNTKFFRFTQTQKDGNFNELVRAHNYSVPLELDRHLESVLNTVQVPYHLTSKFRAPEIVKNVKAEASDQFDPFKGFTTPAKINSYYNVGASKGNSKSTQGVYSALGQYFSPQDLKTFQTAFGLPIQEVTRNIGNYSSDTRCVENPLNCAEGNLDVQYMMATSLGSPMTFWYSDQSFSEWLMDVAAAPSPPLVLSISYAAHEDSMTQSELIAFDTEAIKLGVMGVTLVAASGDDGAVSDSVRDFGYSKCGYVAMFPASSPYVVSVGASSGVETGTTERVAQSNKGQSFTSGGGFSSYYSRPMWQNTAISGYFAATAAASQSPLSGFHENGRGYPDVSIAGCKHAVVLGGVIYILSGTSAAAPVFAGMISNINAARSEKGLGSVGWINPLLYMNHTRFTNDITLGDNHCAANGVCCPQGFSATPGWDPASGLGSADYQKLVALFLTIGGASTALHWPTYVPLREEDKAPSTISTFAPSAAIYSVIEVSQIFTGAFLSGVVQDTFSDYLSNSISTAINLPAVVTSFEITDEEVEAVTSSLKFRFFTFSGFQPQAVIDKLVISVGSGLFLAAFKLQTGLAVTKVSQLTARDVTPAEIASSSKSRARKGTSISIIVATAVLAGVCAVTMLLIIANTVCSRILNSASRSNGEQRTFSPPPIPIISTNIENRPRPSIRKGPLSFSETSVYKETDHSKCMNPLAI